MRESEGKREDKERRKKRGYEKKIEREREKVTRIRGKEESNKSRSSNICLL